MCYFTTIFCNVVLPSGFIWIFFCKLVLPSVSFEKCYVLFVLKPFTILVKFWDGWNILTDTGQIRFSLTTLLFYGNKLHKQNITLGVLCHKSVKLNGLDAPMSLLERNFIVRLKLCRLDWNHLIHRFRDLQCVNLFIAFTA